MPMPRPASPGPAMPPAPATIARNDGASSWIGHRQD
jgi:hypothetical protein